MYIDVAAIDNLAMLCRFGCYCVELAAIDRIGRASSDCACYYAGNLAVFTNRYFPKLSSLICNNVVLGRDRTSCLNRPICSAKADVVASRFPQENIIIQANLVNLLPVDFCFLYIDIAAIDNLNVHCLCLAHSHNASKSQCS